MGLFCPANTLISRNDYPATLSDMSSEGTLFRCAVHHIEPRVPSLQTTEPLGEKRPRYMWLGQERRTPVQKETMLPAKKVRGLGWEATDDRGSPVGEVNSEVWDSRFSFPSNNYPPNLQGIA